MQKFAYTLEQALRWRTAVYDVENGRMAALQQERAQLVSLISMLTELSKGAKKGVADGSSTTGEDLARLCCYRQAMETRVLRLEERKLQCDGRIAEQRKRLIAADRAKQLLEEMKAKEQEEWTYEYNRELENTAGELYVARWGRNG